MQAGQLKHVIDIQVALNSRDGYGASTQEWITFLNRIRALVEPLSGKEFFAAQQVNAEITHSIKIRYRTGIKPAMQVKFGVRYFDIKSVIDIKEERREMYLMCVEVIS